MMKTIIYAGLFLLLVLSCAKQQVGLDGGHFDEATRAYSNQALGWEMRVPDDCIATVAQNKRGKQAVELMKEVGDTIDNSATQRLLSYQYDKNNAFLSAASPYIKKIDHKEDVERSKERSANVYRKLGFNVESSETTMEEIGGKVFYTFKLTTTHPNTPLILTQEMYSVIIGRYEFNVVFNYVDGRLGAEMKNSFLKSNFLD